MNLFIVRFKIRRVNRHFCPQNENQPNKITMCQSVECNFTWYKKRVTGWHLVTLIVKTQLTAKLKELLLDVLGSTI